MITYPSAWIYGQHSETIKELTNLIAMLVTHKDLVEVLNITETVLQRKTEKAQKVSPSKLLDNTVTSFISIDSIMPTLLHHQPLMPLQDQAQNGSHTSTPSFLSLNTTQLSQASLKLLSLTKILRFSLPQTLLIQPLLLMF